MFLLKRRSKINENEKQNRAAQSDKQHFAGQVQVAADQLKGVIEQMKLAALSLNQTSTSSKKSTMELMGQIEKTVDYTLRVSEKMRMIESSALKISAASQEIYSSSQSFYEELIHSWNSLKKLQDEMDQLRRSHHILLKQMDNLVNRSQEINQILSTIGSISQKTSILALNANIESARAGKHGRGFSVVANEVGHLASQTSKAVEQTREILSFVQDEIALTTNMVKAETEQIENGSEEMLNVLRILDSFKEKLSNITAMVSDSVQAAGAQSDSVQEIASLLDRISGMALKNKEHAYRVTLDMDEQHQSIEQMMSINDALEKTSNELQSIIKKDESLTVVQIDETVIESMKKKISTLLQSNPFYEMNGEQHKKCLNEFLQSNTEIEAVWSNKLDGTFIYSNPPAGLVNAKARPWFIEAVKGRIYVSDIYTSALTKNPCITISAPICHNNQVVGVIGVDLSIRKDT
ncbi:methyl-accepting chemotaxis sensory transducer with Cache sensor [Anoxybacillus vitaminiphilus]|uniref:Methyl-accepting chemotaxis sensory transducer with Cache sensor n=1 Tax=Paranoxybacillus vitaminiphilus TaxID=581036 RepID=A0A327YDS7_9BACL|nr:methyl-accepting chemotaxis protein [Anoxybacillus vitaminiphilus]RAK18216.1 methyl-accepting chemotaxis sensory transducer with Cache sensor [Anoxybacillus vitaminiphilus]